MHVHGTSHVHKTITMCGASKAAPETNTAKTLARSILRSPFKPTPGITPVRGFAKNSAGMRCGKLGGSRGG